MSRLATLAAAISAIGHSEPWAMDGWKHGWAYSARKRRNRDLPNEYPKSRATKRRRARNRMAARSRRRNRI